MQGRTILKEDVYPYVYDGNTYVKTKYTVLLETADGHTETQEYIADEATKDAVLAEALATFCAEWTNHNPITDPYAVVV